MYLCAYICVFVFVVMALLIYVYEFIMFTTRNAVLKVYAMKELCIQ